MNLAARLVAVAEPGQVLAAQDVVELLDRMWSAAPGVAQPFRGFDHPVVPYALTRG